MSIFRFGDRSDYRLHVHPGHDSRWYWTLLDGENQPRAVNALVGGGHGWESYAQARADGFAFVRGLGADPKDIDIERTE